jgi:rhodanese-related sulfurtransferase
MRSFALVLTLLAQEIEHTKDSLDMVKANVAKKDAVLVDVREKSEWDAGHLEGAIFLPLTWLKAERDGEKFSEKLAEKLPAKKVLYIHCRAGVRSLTAAAILKKAGYEVRALKPGFEELKKSGLAEAKPER